MKRLRKAVVVALVVVVLAACASVGEGEVTRVDVGGETVTAVNTQTAQPIEPANYLIAEPPFPLSLVETPSNDFIADIRWSQDSQTVSIVTNEFGQDNIWTYRITDNSVQIVDERQSQVLELSPEPTPPILSFTEDIPGLI